MRGRWRKSVYYYTATIEALRVSNAQSRFKWCLDSGCTAHMCNDDADFVKAVESGSGKVNFASDASIDVKGRSSVSIVVETNCRQKNVNIQDALHVPDLRANLLSVGKMADKGFKIVFGKDHARVIDKRGSEVLSANRVNGLLA